MSLMNLFNKNYFVQNLLKSKAVIVLVICLVPILNAITLISMASSNDVYIGNFNEISVINIIGMFVLPIVISLCLFGYIFKKKSVDFINSMPLSRKQIFVTNSIGGILLILIMMLLNTLIILIETLIFSNLIIPFSMILDYFIIWTVSYIFVLMVSNFAAVASGNEVTMLIVTMVLLLFLPFMHNYFTGLNGQLGNSDAYIVDCEGYCTDYKTPRLTKITDDVSYTMPYNILSYAFRGDLNLFNITSIAKMIILSVIYFVLGLIVFNKRKMEVNETSFKSTNLHMLIKSLILLPICIVALYIISDASSVAVTLFILVLLVAYYIIYDLITMKRLQNIKLGILYFVITIAISIGIYAFVENLYSENIENKSLDVNNISEVSFYIDSVDYGRYNNAKLIDVYIKDKELVDIVKENINKKIDYSKNTNNLSIRVKIDGKEYKAVIYLEKDIYDYVVNKVITNKEYEKEYRNINYEKVMAIKFDEITLTHDKKDEMLHVLKEAIDNVNLSKLSSNADVETMRLKLYESHENIEYNIPVNLTDELLEKYIDIINQDFKEKIKYATDINVYDVAIIYNDENVIDRTYYFSKYSADIDVSINILSYLKNNPIGKVDIRKPIIKLRGNIENEFKYTTFNAIFNMDTKLYSILKMGLVKEGMYE